MPDTKTTRGGGENAPASVEAESVTNTTLDPVSVRLPSTGSSSATTIMVLGGGFVTAGALLLAARRRMPATVTVD